MSIALELHGANELVRALDEWAGDVKSIRAPLLFAMQNVIKPFMVKRFADQGPGWKPLSPQYAEWKAIHFPGKTILVRTGAMRTAFTGGVGTFYRVTDNSLAIQPQGSTVPYWKAHQTGTTRMPARPVLPTDNGLLQPVMGYVERWLIERASTYGIKGRL